MKKLLALVLALVMTLGLATVSSSAAYSDDADISYEEAVDVMSALGVFDGTDGAFNPKGTLTREQGAKIIAYMILGKTAADSLSTAAAPFSDVAADRWSAGSIAYCTSEGIIGGVGGNKFDPESKLTGYAFAKMLLVALGYDPEIEGLTGDAWSINTAKLAISAGLKKGGLSKITMSDGITREEACQMAFNTEKADLVQYPNNTTVKTGDVTVVTASKASKIAWKPADNYDQTDNGANGDAYKQFCEEYADDLTLKNTNPDDFGRPAKNWWNGKTEIGTYASTADETYTGKVTRGTLYSLFGKSNVDNLGAGADELNLTVYVDGLKTIDLANVYSDTYDATAGAAAAKTAAAVAARDAQLARIANYFKSNSSAAIGDNNDLAFSAPDAGSKTEVFIDDDNNITIVVINEYVIKAASDYNKTSKVAPFAIPTDAAVPGGGVGNPYDDLKLSSDDFAVTEVKEKDYMLVTVAYGAGDSATKYAVKSVTPAEKLTGSVSTYVGTKSVTIDGTTYTYAATVGSTGSHSKAATFSVGENAVVILDSENNIIYVDDAVSNSKLVFIANAAAESNLAADYVATAVFTDGTSKTITLKSIDGADVDALNSNAAINDWFKYSVASDGKYKLTTETTNNVAAAQIGGAGAFVLVDSGKPYLGAAAGVNANNSTVYVVRTGTNTYDVYNGIANAPDISGASAALTAYYTTSSNAAKYVYIDARNADVTSAVADKSNVIYLLGNGTTAGVTDADGNVYYTYAALVDGEETTINLAEDQSGNSVLADFDNAAYTGLTDAQKKVYGLGTLYYNAKKDSDGYINSLTAAGGNKSECRNATVNVTATNATVGYSGGVLTINGNSIVTSDSTKVYLVIAAKNIMNDAGNDYEVIYTTPSGLKSELNGYYIKGAYDVVYESSTSSTAAEIYIGVTAASTTVFGA